MIAEMADTSESNVSRIEKIWEAADEKTKTALLEEKTTPNKVYQSLFPKTENQKTARAIP